MQDAAGRRVRDGAQAWHWRHNSCKQFTSGQLKNTKRYASSLPINKNLTVTYSVSPCDNTIRNKMLACHVKR